jgi:hypothetical protein
LEVKCKAEAYRTKRGRKGGRNKGWMEGIKEKKKEECCAFS